MKIKYKRKHKRLNLILGIVWLVNGIIQVCFNDNTSWLGYSWFILSALYLVIYYNQSKSKYLSVENGVIKENWLFGKSLQLNDIKTIRHFSAEYILKTEHKKMRINISVIENDSLIELTAVLKKLDVKWL
jgi:hypothetical protein